MRRRTFIKNLGMAAGVGLLTHQGYSKNLLSIPSKKRPNILLIMTDQQSADAMSFIIGKKYINTPAMDGLAAKGTVYTKAYSANPLCVPCRTSLFTGFYPHQTGVQTNSDINKPVADKFKNLGRIFKDSGYDTGYIGKWHMAFDVKNNSVHGFDFMRSIKSNGIDSEIPAGVEEFLKMEREKPFLLVTSFVNPHNICEWPRGDKLPDGEVGQPPELNDCPPVPTNISAMKDEPEIIPLMKRSIQSNPQFPVGNFDEKKWREYKWVYFRMIEKVDSLLQRIINAFKESGLYENTVIVFTSDHGDMQGAHGWNQKTIFFEESTRIPLIISEPGKRKHLANSSLINTGIDILPTLCDYAGISLSKEYPGMSIRDKNISRRKYVVSQNKMIQGEPIDGIKPEPSGRMVQSNRYKYCIYDKGKKNESLVDLERDPGETVNLAGDSDYKNILKEHRNYLSEWCKKYQDDFLSKRQKQF